MSYAEQFFGIKENEAVGYANDLAWFGEDSYVYKSADLMHKVIDSPRALLNPVSNFYVFNWLKNQGEDLSSALEPGFEISLYNSDLGFSIPYVLFRFTQDGNADFMSKRPSIISFNGYSAGGNSSEILNLEDYSINQYLNSGKHNWFLDFSSYNGTVDPTFTKLNNVKMLPGYLHGILKEIKERLIPIKSLENGKKLYVISPSASDMDAYRIAMNESGFTNLCKTDDQSARRFADKLMEATGKTASEVLGGAESNYERLVSGQVVSVKGSSETLTAEQISAASYPTKRDCIVSFVLYNAATAITTAGAAGLADYAWSFAMLRM